MTARTNETTLDFTSNFSPGDKSLAPPLDVFFAEGLAPGARQEHLIPGIIVGAIVGLVNSNEPLVDFVGNRSGKPVLTRTIMAISEREIGCQAVIMFEQTNPALPIVLGLIRRPSATNDRVSIEADGDKFVVRADREIELRCGEASITLTRAGKVLIKGEYVLTRAKGVNRIKGAAVSIN